MQDKTHSHSTTIEPDSSKQKKQDRRHSPYAFLPKAWRRGAFLKWLRRTHAWLGLWGATLALLFGITGILLNHRGVMKINAAKTERTKIELALPAVRPESVEDFARWLQTELDIENKWSRARSEPSQEISWDGQSVLQPEKWRVSFSNPQRTYSAEYWVGNSYTTVTQFDRNVFAFLNRLHMASGMGVAWILLADSIAGSLIILSYRDIALDATPRSSFAGCGTWLWIADPCNLFCLASFIIPGLTQLNGQSPVVRRFIAAGHRCQRPMNRATTIEVRKS